MTDGTRVRAAGAPTSWLRAIPGFRTRRAWKSLVALGAYWLVARITWIGGGAGVVFGLLAVLGVAAVADAPHVRRGMPLIGAPNRLARAAGWSLYGGALFLAFLFALPTADHATGPAGSGTPPLGASTALVSNDESPGAAVRDGGPVRVEPAPRGASDAAASTPRTSLIVARAARATATGAAPHPPAASSPTRASAATPATTPPRPRASASAAAPTAAAAIAPDAALLRVVRVVDGDTIDVLRAGRAERVRLIGIDTPETADPRTVVQCFGREAAARAGAMLAGKRVRIATDASQDEHDKYDRLLAYVWLEDGTFVNQALIAEGFAHEYTYDTPYRYQAEFKAAERQARERSVGLWSPDTCGGDTKQAAVSSGSSASGAAALPPVPPPAAPPAAPTPAAGGGATVAISTIFFDGRASRPESDEYAAIKNNGTTVVNLQGWRLNADDPGQDFTFPSFELQPGQTCRVYTNERQPDDCGGTFGSGQARWANDGECGHLFDAGGRRSARGVMMASDGRCAWQHLGRRYRIADV
ncbi:MAG: thermonuclease family protein, partial [Ardenticatenales bacterium]